MAVDPKIIQELIQKFLPDAKVQVTDLVGDGDHLQAVVVSKEFEGKTLLKQHQLVYAPLQETLKEQLHALALKTYTPQAWEKMEK